MNTSTQPSLIEYPCDFPIKIVGRVVPSSTLASSRTLPAGPIVDKEHASFALDGSITLASLEQRRQAFIQAILTIVKRHAPDFDEASLEVRASKKNTYQSLTCTIRATSRAQLDALYRELCEHPVVVMVL